MNVKTASFATKYFQTTCLIVVMSLTTSGCGQLYRVTPIPKSSVGEDSAITIGTLTVVATAMDGDRSLEHFEGNLPMAGVLAVEVRLKNDGAAQPLSALNYALIDASQERTAPLRPEKALRRVMKFYGNRIYQIEAHRETVASYRQMELRRVGEIGPGEETSGILFFAIPRQAPLSRSYQLLVRQGDQSRAIALRP